VNREIATKYTLRCAQFLVAALFICATSSAHAQAENWRPTPQNSALNEAVLEQRLGNSIPLELRFRSTDGRSVVLSKYFGHQRPVILALGYVECPNLCALVHQGMVHSLEKISLEMGQDYEVISLSIDPNEPLALARSARQRYLQIYGRVGAEKGWHSLVGEEDTIAKIADAIGFRYAYDSEKKQYSHPGALVILTPEGKVSRYFLGVTYDPGDLRLALVEASSGHIGSPVDKVLLRCFAYDPSSGKYSVQIMEVMRYAGGFTTLVLLGGLIMGFRRRRGTNS